MTVTVVCYWPLPEEKEEEEDREEEGRENREEKAWQVSSGDMRKKGREERKEDRREDRREEGRVGRKERREILTS